MRRRGSTHRWLVVLAAVCSTAEMPPISQQARAGLDRALGVKGSYVAEESAYKFSFPRTDVSVRVGVQGLSSAQAPSSWITFSPSMNREAIVSGELVLLEDEANPVISVALKSGLQVTGLGTTLPSEQARLFALNILGEGTLQALGAAVRQWLDEARRIHADKHASPSERVTPPVRNAIDAPPLDPILSMRGTAPEGIYRAAIGRVAMVSRTPIGREMGMRTIVSIFGTNERAFVDAEVVVDSDELQRILAALRTKNLNITSIRNHVVREHPPSVFVRVWGQGSAVDLARALRYALDVQVGAVRVSVAQ